jgi:hypothetical protein
MKHIQAAEDYANRSHKEIEAVFTKFSWATYFNLNFNRSFNSEQFGKTKTPDDGRIRPKHVANKD